MSSQSVCQVAHSCVDVGSFDTRLFGVVYVTYGDFHDGSEKGTASVHHILYHNSTSLRGPKLSCAQVFQCHARFKNGRTSGDDDTQGDPQAEQFLKLLHEFKSSSIRIDVGPITTLLKRWELVMGHANMF